MHNFVLVAEIALQLHLATGVGRGDEGDTGRGDLFSLLQTKLLGDLGVRELVRACGAAAHPGRVDLDGFVAGGAENRPWFVDNPLRVAKVTRILHRNRAVAVENRE